MDNTHQNFWENFQNLLDENGSEYSLEFINNDEAKILYNNNVTSLEILITKNGERVCLRTVNMLNKTIIFSNVLNSVDFDSLLLKIDEICSPDIEQFSANENSTQLVCGDDYGSNAKKAYTELCETLNFDSTQISQFGILKPLFANSADTYRKADVWFICYSNWTIDLSTEEKREARLSQGKKVNLIENYDDTITEIVPKEYGWANNADRVTFAKAKRNNKWTYIFLGVYKLTENGTTRHYKRISKTYPINN